jgi:uncharacterized protein (TIGR02270 family)
MATEEEKILWDVVEEHLDESEFLVELWAASRRSASYTLGELDRGPELRLLGHVDGLVVNGPLALERVAWPVIEDPKAEPARLCAAALAVLEAGDFRVLGVLEGADAKADEAPAQGDGDGDDEAQRLAALQELAGRLDALEADEASRTAVQEFELGAEAWRVSALGKVGERIEAETDDARGVELREIEVLLRAHAPAGTEAAEVEGGEDEASEAAPDWSSLGPEELEQKRQADLKEIEEQLAATSDEEERGRLLELQAMLQADAPEPAEAAEAAPAGAGAEPAPTGEGAEPEPAVDPRIEPLALALALSSHPQLGDQIRSRAGKADGPSLALLLSACADRGLHPGPALERALAHEDPTVLCAALRAATFGDRPKLLAVVEACLQHRSPAVRSVALDTAMMWGSRLAWELALSTYKAPEAANARLWVACLGEDRHAEALVRQLANEPVRHDTLWALGFSGRVPAVVACLALLDDEDELTRRLAGEAVAAIVGLDVGDETLWEEPVLAEPEAGAQGEEPTGDQDDLDAELAPTPEDELPLPNAKAIRERWEQVKSAFVPGRRYVLGKPIEREGPGWALPLLSCRRVDVVAREIVARSQGVGRWPGRARTGRHMQAAGVLAELGRQAGAIQGDRR